MRGTRLIPALCAFFVLTAGLAACGGGESVATVDGNTVSKQAFNHWIYVAAKGQAQQSPGAPVIVPNDPPDFKNCISQARKQIPALAKRSDKQLQAPCKQLFTSLSSQVMMFLITSYWYQAEAAKHHITVSDAQVQQALQSEKKAQFHTDAEFSQFLSQSGQTMQDIVFRVRISQLLKRLLAQHHVTVNPTTIQAYYKSHTAEFGTPQSRDLRIVRTNNAGQAAAAKAALQKGQNWNAVAKQYSVDTATKNKGGMLNSVTRGQQEQALDKAAFAAPVNKTMGPIHGTFGFYIFEVTRIKPAKQQSLAQATPLIKQILQSQSQQGAQSTLNTQIKKDWLSKTQCSSAYQMVDCSGYKAPASSSSSPGAAGGQPQTGQPQTGQPQTGQPQTGQPQTGQPQTGQPQTGQPQTGQPQTAAPSPPTPKKK